MVVVIDDDTLLIVDTSVCRVERNLMELNGLVLSEH